MIKLNDVTLKFEVFPNGETRINTTQIANYADTKSNYIAFKYEDDSDIIKLMFVKNYLDERYNSEDYLTIYYMPYSRMDRVENNSAFTLKYVTNFINSLNFKYVNIIEPHSDVTPALLNRCYAAYPTFDLLGEVIEQTGFNKDEDYLFFPDQGAAKRYGKIKGYKQLVGHKERDFQTGRINKLQVVGEVDRGGFKVIIVDDISSYGGTFILSAEQLKQMGASEIYLLVGHCEESIYKGKIPESDLINKVFTTNTILNESKHPKIHVFEIQSFI